MATIQALKRANSRFNVFTSLRTQHLVKEDGILSKTTCTIKDNISTRHPDEPTTCSSKMLQNYHSPYSATLVTLLEAQGAVILGKTNMDEFGMGNTTTNSVFGPTINPIHTDKPRSAGGSSGGAAASVALDLADFAIGTDTGGSVRLPSSYCQVLGFKPSYSRISRWGVIPYAQSLDTVGVLSKDLGVIEKVFQVLDQHDEKDPTSMSKELRMKYAELQKKKGNDINEKMKIGVPIEFNMGDLPQEVRDEWTCLLIDLSEKYNCDIVPISIPSIKHSLSAYYTLATSEVSSNLSRYDGIRYGYRVPLSEEEINLNEPEFMVNRSIGFGGEVKKRITLGTFALSSYGYNNNFIKAQNVRSMLINEFDSVFEDKNLLTSLKNSSAMDNEKKVDFIICPTSIETIPPEIESDKNENTGDLSVKSYISDVLTIPSSMAGLPTLSFPYGDKKLGFQVIGQFGYDDRLLEFSKRIID